MPYFFIIPEEFWLQFHGHTENTGNAEYVFNTVVTTTGLRVCGTEALATMPQLLAGTSFETVELTTADFPQQPVMPQ